MDKNIERILNLHEEDFITVYKDQMSKVQQELKHLKKKVSPLTSTLH